MKVNSSNNNSQILAGDQQRGLQNANKGGNPSVEEKTFGDAAKIDITDPNAKKADRVLSNETEQFLANKGVDLAKESSSFDKQNVLGQAGSYMVALGQANASSARALLV